MSHQRIPMGTSTCGGGVRLLHTPAAHRAIIADWSRLMTEQRYLCGILDDGDDEREEKEELNLLFDRFRRAVYNSIGLPPNKEQEEQEG